LRGFDMTGVRRQAAIAAVLAAVVFGGSVASAAPTSKKLPAHFPKPPHSKVISKTQVATETAYRMKVKSEAQAFKFWKRKLPANGWTIITAKNTRGYGAIQFKGHGYGPKGTVIGIAKTTASVSFEKSS
jgi:hypothetical protein